MEALFQNLILLFVLLSFVYMLYRQNKKFRAEEKQYSNYYKLTAIQGLYEEHDEETKQIA